MSQSICLHVQSWLYFWANFLSIFHHGEVFCVSVSRTLCVCTFFHICLWAYICVTWGCNSAQDSFIKCVTASKAAVNLFNLLCVGGQLSWHPWTLTPQEWTGWILLLQLCCCRMVVKEDLCCYQSDSNWGNRLQMVVAITWWHYTSTLIVFYCPLCCCFILRRIVTLSNT